MGRQSDTPVVVIERGGNGLASFVVGALAGAALALLVAPRTGEDARAELREGVQRLKDRADEAVRGMGDVVGDTLDTVRDTVGGRLDQARDAFETGRQSAREARIDIEKRARETRERLRAGVEAVRQPVGDGSDEEDDDGEVGI